MAKQIPEVTQISRKSKKRNLTKTSAFVVFERLGHQNSAMLLIENPHFFMQSKPALGHLKPEQQVKEKRGARAHAYEARNCEEKLLKTKHISKLRLPLDQILEILRAGSSFHLSLRVS